MLILSLFTALALFAQSPNTQPAAAPPTTTETPTIPRGRDPWVFRCIFEDRTRMVILAPAPDLWVAFNPVTCAIQKVWKGQMLFRGKVWDFSQDSSAALGEVLAEAPSIICSLPDAPPSSPVTWTADGAHFDASKMWVFDGDHAAITSSAFDLSGWRRVFIAFDETSRAGPFHVELSGDDGATWTAQFFDSTTSGSSDTDWQWNFKQVVPQSSHARIRVVQPAAGFRKTLRHFRVFGDKAAWGARVGDAPTPVVCDWRGYSFDPTSQGCSLRFVLRLPDAREVNVRDEIETTFLAANNTVTLAQRFVIEGLPEGCVLNLDLPSAKTTVEWRVTDNIALTGGKDHPIAQFTHNGGATITTMFTLEAKP